jgi:hypothetical protein
MENKNLEQTAVSAKVPGNGMGRKGSSLSEEILAFKAAYEVKPTAKEVEVRDIFEAAFLAAYGVEPTPIVKDNRVVFIFPEGERVLRLRLDFKKSYIKTQDLAEQVRRLQAKARSIRK